MAFDHSSMVRLFLATL